MLFCPKCNRQVKSDNGFCTYCAEAISQKQDSQADSNEYINSIKNTLSDYNDSTQIEKSDTCEVAFSEEITVPKQVVNYTKQKNNNYIIILLAIIATFVSVVYFSFFSDSESKKDNQRYNLKNEESTRNFDFQEELTTKNDNTNKANSYVISNEKKSSKTSFSIGEINENTYENEYFGFGCTLENWTYYDQKELFSEYLNVDESAINGSNNEAFIQAIKNAGMYVDMQAIGPGISNVNVVVEYSHETPTDYSEKSVLKKINPDVKSHYEETGAQVSSCEVISVPFGNSKKYALYTTLSANGSNFEIYQFVFICENYAASVTVSSDSVQSLNEISKCFYYLQ